MKYWWFLNNRCEFKLRAKILLFGLNDFPIPPILIRKKEEERTCFGTFQKRSSCVDTRGTNAHHFLAAGFMYNFCKFLENNSKSEQNKYTTFINSSWGIPERKMRVVIFWTMCHIFCVFMRFSGTFSFNQFFSLCPFDSQSFSQAGEQGYRYKSLEDSD